MLMRIFDRTVLRDDSGRSLLTHSVQSRDIVRCIAHERLHLYDARGRHTVLRHHIVRIVGIDRSLPLGCLGQQYLDVSICQLQQIAIPGYYAHLIAVLLVSFCYRSYDIIRLIALHGDDRYLHSRQQLLDDRHLLAQLIRHRLARPLIVRIFPVTECRCAQVKCYRQPLRLLAVHYLEHDVDKAVYSVGMQSLGVGQRRDSVEGTVQYTVSVYKYNFVH